MKKNYNIKIHIQNFLQHVSKEYEIKTKIYIFKRRYEKNFRNNNNNNNDKHNNNKTLYIRKRNGEKRYNTCTSSQLN